MDRPQLADFLRRRREALQPEDVGLVKGPRRRTSGLRREEVATLASMSTDYYSRLEQQRGPQPSEQMLASIARGLRLSQDERDHLFRLAGHTAPGRVRRSDHVSPALMRVLDRLDTPAQVISDLGETLVQNPFTVALLGNQTVYTGPARSVVYRWFTDPSERDIYPEADHDRHARMYVAALRGAVARGGDDDPRARELADRLLAESAEFAGLWAEHEVGFRTSDPKRDGAPTSRHHRARLPDPRRGGPGPGAARLYRHPGTEDHEKLQLLSIIGDQRFSTDSPDPTASVTAEAGP